MITIPSKEKKIWSALINAGYDTYLVGGAVRDYVLGRKPNDFDFSTSAKPNEIVKVMKNAGFENIDYVGASFGVVIIDGIEVATFRTDNYSGFDCKNVDIQFADTIEDDLSRRDFTINAMAMSFDGCIIDPFGGMDDIKQDTPVIRFVGNAKDRINEDPNRIIRGARFASNLSGIIKASDCYYIKQYVNKYGVQHIAPERIQAEIMKTMETCQYASIFWEYLYNFGVLDHIFPELVDGVNHPHGNHHVEYVWDHVMIAGDSVSCRYPIVKLAAYMHDIGKPASYDPENYTFIDHQKIGATILRKRLKNLKFSNDVIRKVVNLVLIHMDGTRGMRKKTARRLKNKLNKYGLDWHEWLRVRIADRKANLAKRDFSIFDLRDYIDSMESCEDVPFSIHHLEFKGGDIIKEFNIEPGPLVGELQRILFNAVVDDVVRNKKDDLREYLMAFIFNN